MRIFLNLFIDEKIRSYIWRIVLATSLLVGSSLAYSKSSEQIILVTSKTGGAYQVFVDSFSEEYFNKVQVGSRSEIKNIPISRLSSDKTDWKYKNALIVTVGTKAAKFVVGMKLDSPVIHAMLPFSAYKKIESRRKACSMQSAIYIDQPIKRQIALSKIIFPNRHRYGFLLGDTSKKRYEIERQEHHFSTRKIATTLIEESRELAWSLRDLSDDVDVFIALNDPLVFNPNNAKWLLYMAYQERKPVIGFSKPYVSAGASAAVYSTPSQLGMQTAQQIVKQQKSKNECLFKPQYPSEFSVSINKAVVESLSGHELSEKTLHQHLVEKERVKK
jgi:ABC-type uncharacterized transport system substrate-binding protein